MLLKVKLQILDIINKSNTGKKKRRSSTQGGFPEFSFCLRYLRFKVDKDSNSEVLTGANMKPPNKSFLAVVKRVGKGQPKKTENF